MQVYANEIVQKIKICKENTIIIIKSRLTDEEINLIGDFAIEHKKSIIFGTTHDIIFNKDSNILVIK